MIAAVSRSTKSPESVVSSGWGKIKRTFLLSKRDNERTRRDNETLCLGISVLREIMNIFLGGGCSFFDDFRQRPFHDEAHLVVISVSSFSLVSKYSIFVAFC